MLVIRMRHVTFRIPEQLLVRCKQQAKQDGMTTSEWIRCWLEFACANRKLVDFKGRLQLKDKKGKP